MAQDKNKQFDGKSKEEFALETFTDLMINKIETLQTGRKKPWFTEGTGNQ